MSTGTISKNSGVSNYSYRKESRKAVPDIRGLNPKKYVNIYLLSLRITTTTNTTSTKQLYENRFSILFFQ